MSKRKDNASPNLRDELAALKREKILSVATKLFSAVGYHGCSMDMIASELGVSKPFVYYQFQDKAEILVAICRLGAELSARAALNAGQAPGDPTERLHHFCVELCEIVIDHGAAISVYVNEMNNLPKAERSALEHVRGGIDKAVANLVQAGIDAGKFRDEHPLIQARAITGMISFMYLWNRGAPAIPRAALSALIAGMAMRMVLLPPVEVAD